jgi:hypothetical protein
MSYQRRFQHFFSTINLFLHDGIAMPRWTQGIGIRLTLVLALSAVSLGYVLEISQTAVSGYEIHSLEKEVASLDHDNQKLTVDVARYSSLSSITERIPETKMVRVSNVNYLSLDDGTAVAEK